MAAAHASRGERIGATLPDGTPLKLHVEPMPVVIDGRAVAARSARHDSEAYRRH